MISNFILGHFAKNLLLVFLMKFIGHVGTTGKYVTTGMLRAIASNIIPLTINSDNAPGISGWLGDGSG